MTAEAEGGARDREDRSEFAGRDDLAREPGGEVGADAGEDIKRRRRVQGYDEDADSGTSIESVEVYFPVPEGWVPSYRPEEPRKEAAVV